MECTIQNIKIYYETYGEGTPILMIHGCAPDHRLMKGCMEPVFRTIDSAWKRIYFDLPGMGKTRVEPWITGSDQMLDLVLGFIDAILPDQHFVVAGESYGGYLARGIINKCPAVVDGLLLICPMVTQGAQSSFQLFEKDDILLNSLTEEDRSYFETEGINVSLNSRVWERYKEEVLPGLKIADETFLENCLRRHITLSFDVDALEEPYMKPALMLAGRQDSFASYRGLWQIIEMYPRASFVLLDKAGHALQIEQDTLFTEAVTEWLNRVRAELGTR